MFAHVHVGSFAAFDGVDETCTGIAIDGPVDGAYGRIVTNTEKLAKGSLGKRAIALMWEPPIFDDGEELPSLHLCLGGKKEERTEENQATSTLTVGIKPIKQNTVD